MRTIIFSVILAQLFSCSNPEKKLTKKEYKEIEIFLWTTYVPQSGQAETVQGELIRAIEKLCDEAQRNGNGNFNNDCHGILISFLRETLCDEELFDKITILQINLDLNKLSIEDQPYTEDDIYDRIRHRIVDWYLKHKQPISHKNNPELYC